MVSMSSFYDLYVTAGATNIWDMEPRKIIRSTQRVREFIAYTRDHLPDVSERPMIPDKKVQFWMMSCGTDTTHPNKKKKRYPATHSRLPGLMAKRLNKAIDDTMTLNMWCVEFRDEDDHLVSLVFDCIIAAWLYYIADIKGHPLATANCCNLVLKYMLMNQQEFVKAFHNRVYSFSSGTKLSIVSKRLSEWIDKLDADPVSRL